MTLSWRPLVACVAGTRRSLKGSRLSTESAKRFSVSGVGNESSIGVPSTSLEGFSRGASWPEATVVTSARARSPRLLTFVIGVLQLLREEQGGAHVAD